VNTPSIPEDRNLRDYASTCVGYHRNVL